MRAFTCTLREPKRAAIVLTQDLVLDGSAASQEALRSKESITVTGTLQYQACDDKQCYNPVSLPLSWDAKLRAILRDPAPATAR